MERKNRAIPKDSGLTQRLFSWSLEDIYNEDLYKTQGQASSFVPRLRLFLDSVVYAWFSHLCLALLVENGVGLCGCGGLPLRTSLFWKRIIVGKYGDEERGWCSRDNRDDFGVGLWKAIRRG
ncbi:hypothetical protein CK203_104293 [Vitis vinifera]|uniref:Uncharacterized protein n=1 Tax=Vitis vinifera TaxID=29760 RepID=A0A438EJH5_VITVI|nr:hypothetical protein CK203_104293 [Vitis vinifera]